MPSVAQPERDRRADQSAADDRDVEPSSSRPLRGEAQDRRNLRVEALERVIAAALHVLERAAVERDRLAIVEHLVAGLDEQEVALGPRDARDRERRAARRSARAVTSNVSPVYRFVCVPSVGRAGRRTGASPD